MKFNAAEIVEWLWGIIKHAMEGFAHGCIIGMGVGALADGQPDPSKWKPTLIGGCVGAVKQALLYMDANSLPDVFVSAPSQPATLLKSSPEPYPETKTVNP